MLGLKKWRWCLFSALPLANYATLVSSFNLGTLWFPDQKSKDKRLLCESFVEPEEEQGITHHVAAL